ncbi:MAG TPA: Maf family protein [Stellaceae bacterium]|nr:Maf family protein [Stellaceae bacterium]
MTPNPEALPPVVLASGSAIRLDLLRRAGLTVIADPAGIDEGSLKEKSRRDNAKTPIAAATLAAEKAKVVAARHPEAIVVGADQILDLDGTWFEKPADMEAAAEQLRALSGREHSLVSGLAVVKAGQPAWCGAETAWLTMRQLSDDFIDWYLAAAGPAVLGSVGVYQLEGLGVQLFEKIEGDYFTILGLPLLTLFSHLRGR